MTASTPTILATSGGLKAGRRIPWEVGKLTEYAIELSGVSGRAPKVCFLATAQGDSTATIANFYATDDHRLIYTKRFPQPEVSFPLSHSRQNAESSRNE